MKMKTRVAAATVALGLLGGATATAASPSNETGMARTAAVSTSSSSTLAAAHPVRLRAVKPCLYKGTATTCVIRVKRFAQSGGKVIAYGTVTPRSNPTTHIPFHRAVRGVLTATGVEATCDILGLVLGPLHLDLLGLVVDLNRVVLNITGETGAGNLLGNLLCGLTGILDGTSILTQFQGILQSLLDAINGLLAL
jgi:hypothetical protein